MDEKENKMGHIKEELHRLQCQTRDKLELTHLRIIRLEEVVADLRVQIIIMGGEISTLQEENPWQK